MAKITSYEGKIPKRIGDYIVYKLEDQLIIRSNSGFTSAGLKKDKKYALCRQNASEFGLVSKTCKALRVLVADGLTRHNNLDVVNGLTKKMRSLLVYDTVHERGSRNLKTALATFEAQQSLTGYVLTPDFKLQVRVVQNRLEIEVPDAFMDISACYLGLCVDYLFFDFDSLTGHLESTTWQMQKLAPALSFALPDLAPEDFLLLLYRFSFFKQQDGEWILMLAEEKGLVVGQKK